MFLRSKYVLFCVPNMAYNNLFLVISMRMQTHTHTHTHTNAHAYKEKHSRHTRHAYTCRHAKYQHTHTSVTFLALVKSRAVSGTPNVHPIYASQLLFADGDTNIGVGDATYKRIQRGSENAPRESVYARTYVFVRV
jgi:hypothetical protein